MVTVPEASIFKNQVRSNPACFVATLLDRQYSQFDPSTATTAKLTGINSLLHPNHVGIVSSNHDEFK